MLGLLIDDTVKKIAKNKTKTAYNLKYTQQDLEKIKKGDLPPPDHDPVFVLTIPQGYRCVFTVEQRTENTMVRHLSISINSKKGKKNWPGPHAINQIMEIYGFKNNFESGRINISENEENKSIDVVEICKDIDFE